jgi:acid phosphatase (class A)
VRQRLISLGAIALLGLAAADAPPAGYLAGREPDVLAALSPPPTAGSPADQADLAIFRQTRALKGSPRWALATSDADIRGLVGDFDCALDVHLSRETAPKLFALLGKAAPDINAAFNTPKDFYKRLRPFQREKGEICTPEQTAGLEKSFDYPSGHATWGWTVGLILSRAAPDRAAQVLERARVFGESRVVCGVHDASAVEAARVAGDAVFAALEGDAAFRADLDQARAELDALRASGAKPDPAACKAEADLIAGRPW